MPVAVDHIVVYKIDRLTRSLADFAKLVERLDRAMPPSSRSHTILQHGHHMVPA